MRDYNQPPTPGDLIITKTHDGYAIARQSFTPDAANATAHRIALVSNFEDAADFVTAIRLRDGVRAWISRRRGELRPLPEHPAGLAPEM